ncbi:MAG TPA: hypothetical protein VJQ82_27155 [Terriglobales bacterium]|nr:hypothetical protein [Terriglobales bacterium]
MKIAGFRVHAVRWRVRSWPLLVLLAAFSQFSLAQTSIFSIQNSPSPDVQGNTMNAVSAVSTSDAWAVGYKHDNNLNDSRTLALHWNGSSWATVATPNPGTTPNCRNSNTGNVLNSVSAVSSSDVWAVGFSFTCTALLRPMILHFDGTSWKVVPSPKLGTNDNSALNGVVALASDNVFAVGYQPAPNGAVLTLVEHWDGTSWKIMPSPSPTLGNVLSAIAANSPTDIWAVGTRSDQATTSIQTLVEHFDGTSWKIVPSPNPLPKAFFNQNVLTSLTATSATDVTAVGLLNDAANRRVLTLVEHWDGSKWSVIPSPNQSTAVGALNTLHGVAAVSGGDVYAVGFFADTATAGQEETLIEHFDGSSWSIIASPTRDMSQQLNGAFVLPGTTNVWSVGASSKPGLDPETGFLQLPLTLVLFSPIG